MKYYNVTFKWSDGIYCSNIAAANSEEAVRQHYSKYDDVTISPAATWDIAAAKERGKPIITCEPA